MSDHLLPPARVKLKSAGIMIGVDGLMRLWACNRGDRPKNRCLWRPVAFVVVLEDRLLNAKVLFCYQHSANFQWVELHLQQSQDVLDQWEVEARPQQQQQLK